jgi:hypothetical protein
LTPTLRSFLGLIVRMDATIDLRVAYRVLGTNESEYWPTNDSTTAFRWAR